MMRPALTPGVWDVIDNPDDLNEFSIATDENGIEPATRIIDGGESVQLPKPTRVHGVMQLHPTVHKAPWSLATYYAQRAMEADHDAAWKNKVVQEIASQVGQASNRAGKAALAARHYYLQSIAADAKDMLSSLRQFCSMNGDNQLGSATPEVQDFCATFHNTYGPRRLSPFLSQLHGAHATQPAPAHMPPHSAPRVRLEHRTVDGSAGTQESKALDVMIGRRELPSLRSMAVIHSCE
eukprot:GEMP01071810.1.p1 GENE.GEMP01071810.1~~GEMP01071810.1.p1  ORF type:complete len:237 (+),score=66.86 GEMP01071810.1:209-919(+)